ncbi:hypothetical protein LT330_007742 [Penicillium expansum]|uniref:DUF202 domain-containing protein n=1 Tax=Penicillium expansum TaxID=27334 RepID=A0A0A2K8T4_PENEN|nr:protein of unknown function DUF202 [Penicillium expansum]KAJ5506940.1 hypothetical protein N7453_005897 [Penicillium expansum]KAK4867001.1 hypothetical protein LT330_007742 [Penicillium expansum]KGO42041.1 protein of unknown function DUF202 [Penicillium expansum]KGO63286.1 protein of unknown function DUF202 [Penicillium expansum]KGO67422.1 protein of unknown function DUF202 [Penicillium expansum]
MSPTVTQVGVVRASFNPLINPVHSKPVLVEEHIESQHHIFLSRPYFGALLFENNSSDARDHCANERTFLSWLRLSMYLAVVSLAIIISFHFREQPTGLERRMALPLGIIFWLLSLTCLANGFANYSRTVKKYARKAALVQSGWKTQVVFTVVGTVILGSCILFLSTDPAQ